MGTAHSVFDLEMLESLLSTLGKTKFSDLVHGFLKTSDDIVSEFARIEGFKNIYDKAHEMKGMAANYGFAELSAIALEIENAAKTHDTQAIAENIKKLSDANRRAKVAIMKWLENAA